MKRKMLCLSMIFLCLIPGCKKQNMKSVQSALLELNLISSVEKENCFICGNPANAASVDSIGIIHWADLSVIDTEVRNYDSSGNEILTGGHRAIRQFSFGESYGSALCTNESGRGLSEVKIFLKENDTLDYESLEDVLCQDCLDQVAQFYEDQVNIGEEAYYASTGFCLLDFATGDLYSLSQPYCGHSIRNYIVRFTFEEDDDSKRINLFIFYAPSRLNPQLKES